MSFDKLYSVFVTELVYCYETRKEINNNNNFIQYFLFTIF